MSSRRRVLLTLSSNIVARSLAWLIAIERSVRKSCLYWIRAVSLQISSHEVAVLNSEQLEFSTSVSYEYRFWTEAVADAFWRKASESWSKSIDFVKLSRMHLLKIKMNISIKFGLDILQCKISSSWIVFSISNPKNQSILLSLALIEFFVYSYEYIVARIRLHIRCSLSNELV